MNKYTLVNMVRAPLPFSVLNPSGTVVAIFRSEKRAQHCVDTMNKMKDKYLADI